MGVCDEKIKERIFIDGNDGSAFDNINNRCSYGTDDKQKNDKHGER